MSPDPAAYPRGIHHVGVSVRSIERSLEWYRQVLDVKPEFVDTAEGDVLDRTVQLPDAKLRFAFLPLGNTILELVEYERPVGADFSLRNCDVGAVHVCFEVDDIERVHRRLVELGAEFSIEPTLLTDGAVAGHRCCYLRDPDGIQLELWQTPDDA